MILTATAHSRVALILLVIGCAVWVPAYVLFIRRSLRGWPAPDPATRVFLPTDTDEVQF